MDTQSSRAATVWSLVLLFLVKGLFVLSIADVFFYGEELEKGAAAKGMLDDLPLAHHELAYHAYEGGGFVISHIKAALFLVVGESILAHKLAALVSCVAILLAGLTFVRRHFGSPADWIFGLLFTLGPASYQKIALLSLGIHFEALFFVIVIFDRALRLLRERERDAVHLVILGLASGFGIYFSYQVVLAVGFAGLALLIGRRDLIFGRSVFTGLAALIVGLLPLILMYLFVGERIFDIHGSRLAGRQDNMERIAATLRLVLIEGTPLTLASAWIYGTIAALSVLSALRFRAQSRTPFLFLAGFAVLWCAVYANSSFAIGAVYHYSQFMRFAPLWLVGLLCTTGFLRALWNGNGRRVAQGLMIVLFALGTLHAVDIIGSARPRTLGANLRLLSQTKGYFYEGYAPKILPYLEGRADHPLQPLLAFDEPERALLLSELAAGYYLGKTPPLDELFTDLERLEPDDWRSFLPGLGPTLAQRTGGDILAALDATLGFEDAVGLPLARGVGRFGSDWAVSRDILTREIALAADHDRRSEYWRGAGERTFRAFVIRGYGGKELILNPEAAREFLRAQLPPAVPDLLEGFDQALAAYTLP